MDPASLSEMQFYECEQAIISGYSGSGGHFLEGPQIAWLMKAESAFEAKGVHLQDKWDRGFVIADSYLNSRRYKKALDAFRRLGNQHGIELTEWFINNRNLSHAGKVKLVEYDGEIPCEASETARAEDERYLFVAFFKGPIYRYDKLTKKHAIIYAPEDKYDWCDVLSVEGLLLTIELRDNAGNFQFNNVTHELLKV